MKTTLPPTLRHLFTLLLILLLTAACRHEAPMTNRLVDHRPPIFPDYTEVTIPPNIAPLRFLLADTCDVDKAAATFEGGAERVTVWASDGRSIAIAPRAWKRLMKDAAGKVISVKVTARIAGEWVGYAPFNLYVATDSIDPYIVYGRTDPSRDVTGHTGLYSRCLEDFREQAVLTSDMIRGDRIGPATFSGGDAQRFFLPLSGALSCALLTDSDKIEKLNTHTIPGLPTPTHIAWHPSGRYMAFAVNRNARQDARETASRIVIYDVVKHELFTSPQLFSDSSSVTYPAFSPDGETLYFCARHPLPLPTRAAPAPAEEVGQDAPPTPRGTPRRQRGPSPALARRTLSALHRGRRRLQSRRSPHVGRGPLRHKTPELPARRYALRR